MTKAATRRFAWLVAAALLWSVPPAIAQQSGAAAPPATAALDNDAAHLRDLADQAAQRAAGWDDLAKKAQETAAKTTDPATKKSWEDRAREHATRAKEQRDEAARLTTQAKEKDAQASKLKAAPSPATQPPATATSGNAGETPRTASSAPPPAEHAPVEAADFIGVWRDADNGRALVIEPRYPNEPDKANVLEAKSQGRHDDKAHDWVGTFVPATTDKPAKLTLTTTPKFDEMNLDIPEWVRKKIENELKWQVELELDQAFPFDPRLKAKWYPGEVTWTETAGVGGDAKVTGRGEPLDLTYAADGEVDMDMVHAPVIDLDFPGRKPLGRAEVFYMAKRDQFRLVVTLPKDAAKAQGEKLEVTFRGLTGGSTTSIELETTAPQLRDITARYTHPDLITIANYGDVPNREPLFGLFIGTKGLGPRIPLAVKNGEVVEISAAGASRRIRVFDRPVDLALARQLDGIRDLAIIFSSALVSKVPNATKEVAARRLRMVATAEHIAADESLAPEVRLAAINEYLSGDGSQGWLLAENLHWIEANGPNADPDALKVNRFGTLWAAYEEAVSIDQPSTARQITFDRNFPGTGWVRDRAAIPRAMRIYREKVEGALAGLVSASTFALYNIVVDFTQGEAVVGWFFGLDRNGNEISVGRRVLAALELTTTALSGALVLDIPATSDVLGPTRRTVPRTGAEVRIPIPTVAPGTNLPPSLKEAIPRRQPKTPLGSRPASTPASTPGGGKYMRPRDPSPIEVGYPAPSGAKTYGNPKASFPGDPAGTQYPQSGEKVLDLDFSRNAQTDPVGCTAAAISDGFELGGVVIDQANIRRAVVERRGAVKPGAPGPVSLDKGIWYEEIAPIMKENGIPHELLPNDRNVLPLMKQYHDRGFQVVVGQGYAGGNHSVSLRGFVKDSSGRVTHVTVFDPGPGDIRKLTAQEFSDYVYAAQASIGPQHAPALVYLPR